MTRKRTNLGTLVGHVIQAIRSRITYVSFVYGFEAIFIFGLVSLAVTLEIFEWPREIAVFVAIGGLLNNVIGKLKGSMSIVSKWFSYKVATIPDEELLKLDRGPQWNSSRGVFFKSQDNPRTQQTLFWTDLAVNSYLSSNQDFFVELKTQDYELPKLLRQMAPVALKSSNVKTGRRKLPIRFNGKLVRLATEPTLEQLKSSNLELQKVSYFDGECSNEILKFRDLKAGGVSPVEQFTFDREKKFKALENSAAANIIGISIFAITADGYVVFVRQTESNSVSPGSFASSGSGSLEFKDLKKFIQASSETDGQMNFKEVLRGGLLRELYEESAVLPGDVDFSTFRLTSYFRWISRAAKPEFTALVNLKCNFSDLKARNTNLKEKAFSKNITSVPLSYLQKSAKQLKTAEGKNDEKLARAMEATVLLASEGLTATHKKWSQSKASQSELHLSPSCEFAWFAAAMYLSTIDSAETDKL